MLFKPAAPRPTSCDAPHARPPTRIVGFDGAPSLIPIFFGFVALVPLSRTFSNLQGRGLHNFRLALCQGFLPQIIGVYKETDSAHIPLPWTLLFPWG